MSKDIVISSFNVTDIKQGLAKIDRLDITLPKKLFVDMEPGLKWLRNKDLDTVLIKTNILKASSIKVYNFVQAEEPKTYNEVTWKLSHRKEWSDLKAFNFNLSVTGKIYLFVESASTNQKFVVFLPILDVILATIRNGEIVCPLPNSIITEHDLQNILKLRK